MRENFLTVEEEVDSLDRFLEQIIARVKLFIVFIKS